MINTFELLLNVSNVTDGVQRDAADSKNELAARKLVVADYITAHKLPETINKAQVGEVVQQFAHYYM